MNLQNYKTRQNFKFTKNGNKIFRLNFDEYDAKFLI